MLLRDLCAAAIAFRDEILLAVNKRLAEP